MRTLVPVMFALTLSALTAPALAHNGLMHEGCDPNATFTAGGLTVSGAFSRAMLPNAPTAGGYFTITNAGPDADRLVGATSAAAETVQLHRMTMEGNMMKMSEVEGGVEIPAGGSVTLEPAGLHMMFTGIGTPFKEGECVAVTLQFETAGEVPVVLAIGGPAAGGPPEMQMEMGGHQHMEMAPAQ